MSRQAQPGLFPPHHTPVILVHAQEDANSSEISLPPAEISVFISRNREKGLSKQQSWVPKPPKSVAAFSGAGSERRCERQQRQLGGAERAAERGQDNRTLADAVLRRGAHTHTHTQFFIYLLLMDHSNEFDFITLKDF